MSKLRKTFAKNLKQRLGGRGEKAEFLRKSRVSPTSLNAWMNGVSAPDLDSLETIAKNLGVAAVDLLMDGPGTDKEPIEQCYRRIGEALTPEGGLHRWLVSLDKEGLSEQEVERKVIDAVKSNHAKKIPG